MTPTADLPETTEHRYTTWMTSRDNIDHAVTDEENVAGHREHRGTRRAVCGTEFLTALLETPPGWTCQDCQKAILDNARSRRIQELRKGSEKRRRSTRRRLIFRVTRLLRRRDAR